MALLTTSALAGGTVYPARAAGTPVAITFTPAATGGPPAGFSVALTGGGPPPVWSVIADASAPTGHVLAQTSTDRTDLRFPLLIHDGLSAADLEVSVRFKAIAGRVDRAAGIALRLADPGNYYVVRANALEDNVNLYRVVGGSRRQIAGASVKVTSDTWHSLALKAEGDTFSVSFNGKQLFVAKDTTFPNAGKVALWTKADSVTHFDQLMIRTLP
jgi:uncharacterized protein YneR